MREMYIPLQQLVKQQETIKHETLCCFVGCEIGIMTILCFKSNKLSSLNGWEPLYVVDYLSITLNVKHIT